MNHQDRIRRHTRVAAPWLVPEVHLHLVTPDCALWRSSGEEAAALGIAEPYWAFAWPGGQALARYLLDAPDVVEGRSVLDFGAGSGIVGIAAARAGATRVLCADTDPAAVAAVRLNATLNHVPVQVTTLDLVGRPVEAEVVLAGDVTYERDMARKVLDWLRGVAARGTEVLLADPGRGFLDGGGLEPVASLDAPQDIDDGKGRYLRSVTIFRVGKRR